MQRQALAVIFLVPCMVLSTVSAEARGHHRQQRHAGRHHHVHRVVPQQEQNYQAEQTGLASFYHENQRVACGGERFNPNGLTAAHRTLPCGTMVEVTNKRNGRSVMVQINDRGPARWTHRIIDLSRQAGAAIDMLKAGVVPVTVETVRPRDEIVVPVKIETLPSRDEGTSSTDD
jgi:rare lipoprotein A